MIPDARQLAFEALCQIERRGAYADIALDRVLRQHPQPEATQAKSLATELVYGITRQRRTLDALLAKFAKKTPANQRLELRLLLELGAYQLCYLERISSPVAIYETVELAKRSGLSGLAGVVNGILRSLDRAKQSGTLWDGIDSLGDRYSFPDWLVSLWEGEYGIETTARLCAWFNRPPHIDVRVNTLRASVAQVAAAMQEAGIAVETIPYVPSALRLPPGAGAIAQLPGYTEGWWSVQDASAQLATWLLDPQPGEVAIDACAAPGGKATHIAERMGDRGTVWACDLHPSRLQRVERNAARLGLTSLRLRSGDSRTRQDFIGIADRVLADVPCSGLGTLHRHADARWRQGLTDAQALPKLQGELLEAAAAWVKPGGVLVYSTCTLHAAENEGVVTQFLAAHPLWRLDLPRTLPSFSELAAPEGWIRILPCDRAMDGFFMARLVRGGG